MQAVPFRTNPNPKPNPFCCIHTLRPQLLHKERGCKTHTHAHAHFINTDINTIPTRCDLRPQQLYKDLGCKTVVGLPFKDIATADAYLLREVRLGAPVSRPRSTPTRTHKRAHPAHITLQTSVHTTVQGHRHRRRVPAARGATHALCTPSPRPRHALATSR